MRGGRSGNGDGRGGGRVDGAKANAGTTKVIVSKVVVFDAGEYWGRASTATFLLEGQPDQFRSSPSIHVDLCTDHKS